MGRWSPGARGRLEEAAYALFARRGYDRTTVAEIAAEAGVTERTFFRHYADKREALFGGTAALLAALEAGLAAAPASAGPFDAARAAVTATATFLRDRREHARERRAVIEAHADLRERGLVKRAALCAALARGLEGRGVASAEALLAAETAIAAFYAAFDRWLDAEPERGFATCVDAEFDRLKRLVATAPPE